MLSHYYEHSGGSQQLFLHIMLIGVGTRQLTVLGKTGQEIFTFHVKSLVSDTNPGGKPETSVIAMF